jgi:PAS domain S-box-containing protein
MTLKDRRAGDAAELRLRAEEALRESSASSSPVGHFQGSPQEAGRLLQELRTHQVELEMQNEELRRAQAELDAVRARYFDLYDLAPVGYCTISEEGSILEANLTASKLLGVARGELIKQRITRFIIKEDEDTYYQHRRQLLESGDPQNCELRMVKGDGTVFWTQLEAAVEQSPATGTGPPAGDASVCRIVMSDITEHKRAETSLIDSLNRNKALLEAIPDMFFVFAADGRIVDAKTERPEDLYVPPETFLGKHVREVLPPDLAHQTLGFIAEAQRTHELVQYTYTLEVRGEPKEFESRLVPCEDGTFMALVRNITERRRAEAALQRSAEELKRSNEEIRQFAYIVSHDLRGPLCNVGGFVSELRRSIVDLNLFVQPVIKQLGETERAEADRILGRDVSDALGFIDSSVVRMDRLVSSLLRLSQMGRHEQRLERLALGPLVSGLLATLRTQIEARGATVTVHPLPEIMADRVSVELVVSNLLGNAVLYLDPARPGRIEVEGTRNAAELFMKISDNGRGIAPEHREQVFAPFRRAGSPDVPGEGMGLAYVQALLRRQGGRIWFDSQPGVGTTFSFVLPVDSPPGLDCPGS